MYACSSIAGGVGVRDAVGEGFMVRFMILVGVGLGPINTCCANFSDMLQVEEGI